MTINRIGNGEIGPRRRGTDGEMSAEVNAGIEIAVTKARFPRPKARVSKNRKNRLRLDFPERADDRLTIHVPSSLRWWIGPRASERIAHIVGYGLHVPALVDRECKSVSGIRSEM